MKVPKVYLLVVDTLRNVQSPQKPLIDTGTSKLQQKLPRYFRGTLIVLWVFNLFPIKQDAILPNM